MYCTDFLHSKHYSFLAKKNYFPVIIKDGIKTFSENVFWLFVGDNGNFWDSIW